MQVARDNSSRQSLRDILKGLTAKFFKHMKWTDIPAGTLNAATQRMWNAFGDQAGIVADRIINNPTFMEGVASLIITGGIQPSVVVKKARKIMGSNFSGIEEAVKNWGIIPTKRQLAVLSVIPWGEETLQKVKDTHILVAVFPVSILDIRKTVDRISILITCFLCIKTG